MRRCRGMARPACVAPCRCRRPACADSCLQQQPPLDETRATVRLHLPAGPVVAAAEIPRATSPQAACWREAMAERCASLPRPDALVPVPLHRARLRQRGYDQALELAKPLAHALRLPLLANALQRRKTTTAQSRLDAAARQRNLRDAFVVVGSAALARARGAGRRRDDHRCHPARRGTRAAGSRCARGWMHGSARGWREPGQAARSCRKRVIQRDARRTPPSPPSGCAGTRGNRRPARGCGR